MRFKSYIDYRNKRVNAHGIHSPYVFEFYNEVLKKAKKLNIEWAEIYVKNVLQSKVTIRRDDFGAGSGILRENEQVSKIGKVAGTYGKYGKLLTRIIQKYNFQSILEVGTSVGLGTAYMAAASKDVSIDSIEGCGETYSFAKENLELMFPGQVKCHHSDFDVFFDKLDNRKYYDLIFIDGNHRKEPTLKYFNILKKHLAPGGLLIFDDIHWSEEMENAWGMIKKDEEITVTIDLFRFGIVSFREGQAKENFILKY